MTETGKRANNATISDLGIKHATAHWNLSPEELADIAIKEDQAILTLTLSCTALFLNNNFTWSAL